MRTALALTASVALFAQRAPSIDDFFKVQRVSDPQASSSNDVAYQVGTVDMAANKVINKIWIFWGKKNNGARGGANPLDLGEGSQSRPRFSPDAQQLAYLQSGQIWIADLESGQKHQLTKISGGAGEFAWSPDGKWIAFVSTTVPSGDETENAAYVKTQESSKVKARHIKTLMYRHWNEWKDPRQVSHLFVIPVDGSVAPRDLTAGVTFDVPNFADVAAGDGFSWAPDSSRIAFEGHPEQTKAISTNGEIYEVMLSGGAPKKITNNPAMDSTPRYSPDGKHLAWRAQRRPGFESDKWELRLMDRSSGKISEITRLWDQSVGMFAWKSADELLIASDAKGHTDLYARKALQSNDGAQAVTKNLHVEGMAIRPTGHVLITSSDSATPVELYDIDMADGTARRFSRHNLALASELNLNRAEELWFGGAPNKDGKAAKVQAFVVKPVNFDAAKKYPVAFLIHGGPQGAWMDNWGYRWNPQLWASRGFLTVMVNPRGSTGYGQTFCDEISGDWNGKVMVDLIEGLDAALAKYPNADRSKVIAAGGSYGGYATNWLAGHHGDRFAAFISHASIYNLESMQVGSEELWFPNWEFGGFPWKDAATRTRWEKQSPHRAAGSFTKPMLVIHGELDYRVPVQEAFQLFNTLQLRGIPSELLYYPDEGHWVLKPQNSKLWFETVTAWSERWAK
jgi:dipeptidyl aminopeptidase/acylaminoacyl peptidase